MRLRTSAVEMDRTVRGAKVQPARGRRKYGLTETQGSESEGEEESVGEQLHTQEDLSKHEVEVEERIESLTEFQEIENSLQPESEECRSSSARKRRTKQERLNERSLKESKDEAQQPADESEPQTSIPEELFEGLPPKMVAMVKEKIGALDGEITRFKRENRRYRGGECATSA